MAIGDVLMSLGRPADAVRAYDLAVPSCTHASERRCVAALAAALAMAGDVRAVGEAVKAAHAASPPSGWCSALAAVGWALAGERDSMRKELAEARRLGGPGIACDVAEALDACAARIEGGRLAGLASGVAAAALGAALRLLLATDPLVDRATEFIQKFGDRWLEECPAHPEPVARAYLTGLCRQAHWSEAAVWAKGLVRRGFPWAHPLAATVNLGYAFSLAAAGNFDRASALLTPLARSNP